MTTDVALDQVREAIHRDLGDPSSWGVPVEMRDSLALCALNSAYSLQTKSASVRKVLRRYREHRVAAGADPSKDSGTDLLAAMDAAGGPRPFSLKVLESKKVFPNTNRLRSEAVSTTPSPDLLTSVSPRPVSSLPPPLTVRPREPGFLSKDSARSPGPTSS